MSAPIDKSGLAGEKAKLLHALEHAGAIPARTDGASVAHPLAASDLPGVDRSKWTFKQWYQHVGAWETPEGHISFGSPMAVRAMLIQFGRSMAAAPRQETKPAVQAVSDVLAERKRQVDPEGWTPEHDDAHPSGEIAAFAALYAMPPAARDWPALETGYGETFGAAMCPDDWTPKFGDRRRELVKAGALILAEIERMDRARTPTTSTEARR